MKSLKEKIRNRELTVGSWITLAHPAIPEIMANAGFDWLVVDLEHSVITIQQAEELIRVISLSGATPLVRLTSNNPDQIKRVMDAGSHGVIIPSVNSREEALTAIQSTKYPPKGNRGFGLARAQGYGRKFSEYLGWESDNPIIVVQIEHMEAVNNIDSIFSLDEIDAFIIGPYDLSGSIGVPGELDHPEMNKAMNKIFESAERFKKPGGLHLVEPDPAQLSDAIADGHKFIAYSLDTRMLDHSCSLGIKAQK